MRHFLIAQCFWAVFATAQPNEVKFIEVKITADSLPISARKPNLKVLMQCKNASSKKLLIYGFDSNVLTMGVDYICLNQDHISGGIGLRVFDENKKRVDASHMIIDSSDKPEMTRERLDQVLEQEKVRYLEGTRIIDPSSVTNVEKAFDLKDFHLKKGKYYLQIIVYGGKSLITHMVGKKRIEEDKKNYGAELYQGCAISNETIFSVE